MYKESNPKQNIIPVQDMSPFGSTEILEFYIMDGGRPVPATFGISDNAPPADLLQRLDDMQAEINQLKNIVVIP